MELPYLQQTSGGVIVRVHAQPNAKRSEVAGMHGDSLKIRLQAPPVEGRANAALVAFLGELLEVPKSAVEIVRGETSRTKHVLVRGRTAEELAALNLHERR